MRLNQESLDHMAWHDYHALEDRMCAWTLAAEAELQSAEKPRQIIIDLLGWARGSFTAAAATWSGTSRKRSGRPVRPCGRWWKNRWK